MEKFLEKVYEAQAFANIAAGLSLARTLCRRKLLEADGNKQTEIVLSLIQEIETLSNIAQEKALEISKQD
jgi:cAMP phosphodiesterase